MPPKKVPRIEKGQKTLFSFAAKEGSSSESTDTAAASSSSNSSEITDTVTDKEAAASSSRTFRAAWIKEFQPWLQYNRENTKQAALCQAGQGGTRRCPRCMEGCKTKGCPCVIFPQGIIA